MKNQICLYVASLALMLVSCGDFLSESSQDEVRPSTTTDLEELLLGDGYVSLSPIFPYLELLTDNVESNYSNAANQEEALQKGAAAFTWADDMFEQMKKNNVPLSNSWQQLYHWINGCNVVIDELPSVTGSTQAKQKIEAEALGLRSFYYFLLVNAFAPAYDANGTSSKSALAIPLVLKSTVKDEFPKRRTVEEVYQQIESDLLKSKKLWESCGETKNSVYTVSPLFVDMLLSRLYLYEGKWDEAIRYSSAVIEQKPSLMKLDQYYTYDDWQDMVLYDIEKGGVYNSDSPELIWGYSINGEFNAFFIGVNPFIDGGKLPAFTVSKELAAMYEPNDIRREAFFNGYMTRNGFMFEKHLLVGRKSDNVVQNPTKGMRVAEAYLNRAEAYARQYLLNHDEGLRSAALKDLNMLREYRFTGTYEPVDITDGEELLKFCLDERRRELCFEDQRWFDLKRLGMPAIEHSFSIVSGQIKTYRLEQGSSKYVLPIPLEVRQRNPELDS
jgi:hypothetical protein